MGVGVGAGAEICPEPEKSKMTGSGNHDQFYIHLRNIYIFSRLCYLQDPDPDPVGKYLCGSGSETLDYYYCKAIYPDRYLDRPDTIFDGRIFAVLF